MPPSDGTAAIARAAKGFSFGKQALELSRPVPVEMPVNIVYAPLPYAVMMATPQDLEDFVVGFSFTEGVIASASDIRALDIVAAEGGLQANVSLVPGRMQSHLARTRNLSGRTGCGVCGIEDLASLPKARVAGTARITLHLSAIRRALMEMSDRQSLNHETHAVHAAAWCDRDGHVHVLREDVGRHNALDKLIGALLRAGQDPALGFVAITSRCSFEMVEKAAAFGISALVAVSAPTSLAIERAGAHDMALVAIARADGAMAFTHAERIIDDLCELGQRRA